MRMSCI